MRALPPARWLITLGLRALLIWIGVRGLLAAVGVGFGVVQAAGVVTLTALLGHHDSRLLRERVLLADLGYPALIPAFASAAVGTLVESIFIMFT